MGEAMDRYKAAQAASLAADLAATKALDEARIAAAEAKKGQGTSSNAGS
jgi:hypothetical protein